VSDDTDTTATVPQGDLRLLDTPVAVRLLASTTPARLAYVAEDGTPRVVPTWFHWNGEELVMPTFVAAPHIRRPARRIASLRANPAVALSIDTDGSPPHVLLVRGEATVEDIEGVAPEYGASARRYLGDDAAASLLSMVDDPITRMARIAVRPAWVGVLDFETRQPGPIRR
jgi:Pyridoxamine 5'-phosphate oxidase